MFESINNKVSYCYVIRKEVIEKSTVSKLLRHMKNYFKYDGTMTISFDGYENDKRELCEIPEVVAFATSLITQHPQIIFNWNEITLLTFMQITTGTIKQRCCLSRTVEWEVDPDKLKKLFGEPIKKYSSIYCKSQEHYDSLINVFKYINGEKNTLF